VILVPEHRTSSHVLLKASLVNETLDHRNKRDANPLQSRVQRAFCLTSAEVRLTAALAEGTSLKEYAASAGITEGTARVQLKSVFAKTGTHRQAELVALFWRLAQSLPLDD
jgi:DNA-binding CsgD family transcriptional regulator